MSGKRVAAIGGLGAAAMYFFDPRMGRTRLTRLAQRVGGITRRTTARAERKGRYVAGHAYGVQQKAAAAARPDEIPPNDQALVAKIESEVLSRWNYPKGNISIDAADGVVTLRGTAENPDQIKSLESEVGRVAGVSQVVNYLHMPGTDAPNKADALEASR
ncbi:MAG TPA: BON domain-containing protein [Actinomycetota bacterium]|nr:BON domain-containing protein [Actinomycetota bacterium]